VITADTLSLFADLYLPYPPGTHAGSLRCRGDRIHGLRCRQL